MASNTPRLDGLERNLYINGNMDFWQRGTSISKSQGAYLYTADRLKVGGGGGGSGAYTISRSTDVPTLAQSGFNSLYSALWTTNTAATSSYFEMFHYIVEGYDYQQIHGKKVRLQFWVKSSASGTYSLVLAGGGATVRSYVTTYTVTAANTWQKVAIDIQLETLSAGFYNFDNTAGLYLFWILGGNQVHTSTLNAWQTGSFYGTSSQTSTVLTTIGATFQIAQVSVIPQDFTLAGASNVDIPFQRAGRTIGHELAMCKRYCEVINKTATGHIANGYVASTTGAGLILNFEEKRVAPTISFSAASSYNILCGAAQTTCTSIGTSYIDVKSANLVPNATGLSLGQAAILVSNTTTAIIIDAEL